jgi:hypothetical protein
MTTKLTTTTRLAAEFKGSPRYQAILTVFAAVDALEDGASTIGLSALVSRTLQDLNGIERDRLPDLVRQALKERGHSHRF